MTIQSHIKITCKNAYFTLRNISGRSIFRCDYEDGNDCSLKNSQSSDEQWIRIPASLYKIGDDTSPGRDHTTDLGIMCF